MSPLFDSQYLSLYIKSGNKLPHSKDLAITKPEDYLMGALLETAFFDGGDLNPDEANPDDDSLGSCPFALQSCREA